MMTTPSASSRRTNSGSRRARRSAALMRSPQRLGHGPGCVQAVPDADVEAAQARLRRASAARPSAGVVEPLARRHAVGPHPTGTDRCAGVGGLVAQQVDMAGQQVAQRRRGALVRHGFHADADALLQQQAAQVRRRALTGIGQVDPPLVGAQPVEQFGKIAGRQRRATDQRHRHLGDHAEKLEIVQRAELQAAVQRRRGRDADVRQQQRVAVGARLGDPRRGQRSAGTGHILDQRSAGRAAGAAPRPGRAPACRSVRRRRTAPPA